MVASLIDSDQRLYEYPGLETDLRRFVTAVVFPSCGLPSERPLSRLPCFDARRVP
jgi:hypothetical protein